MPQLAMGYGRSLNFAGLRMNLLGIFLKVRSRSIKIPALDSIYFPKYKKIRY